MPDGFGFRPGTFDLEKILDRLQPRLLPRNRGARWTAGSDYYVEVWQDKRWQSPLEASGYLENVGLVADFFEMIRQRIRAKSPSNNPTPDPLAMWWRLHPPTSLSRPWDAPVEPVGARSHLPPEPSDPETLRPEQRDPGAIAFYISGPGAEAYVTTNGSAALRMPYAIVYLPPGTFNVAALNDWIKPQLFKDGGERDDDPNCSFEGVASNGLIEQQWFRNPLAVADVFELFRYAFKAQGWQFLPIESAWRNARPAHRSKSWDCDFELRPELLSLFANKALQSIPRHLDASAKSPLVAWISHYQRYARHEMDPFGFLWFVVVRANGEGELHCGVEPQARVAFPPGTFDVLACTARWRAEVKPFPLRSLLTTKPRNGVIGRDGSCFVIRDPTNKGPLLVLWPTGYPDPKEPATEVFELVRQACQRQKPKELEFIASRWKLYPPAEHAKPWDAPIELNKPVAPK